MILLIGDLLKKQELNANNADQDADKKFGYAEVLHSDNVHVPP